MTVQTYKITKHQHFYVGESGDTKPSATSVPAGSRFFETDTSREYWATESGWISAAIPVDLYGRIAGETNPDSATNAYLITRKQSNVTIISTTAAVTIGGGAANDTHLLRVHIHTALAGTCVIAGFRDETGAAKSYTLPVGSVGTIDFEGALNAAGALTVTCSTAGDDDKVMVFWRPVT